MAIHGKLNIEPELATIGSYDGDGQQDWKKRAGSGPWSHEPFDFMVWVDSTTGYTCAMKRNHGGAWCGYVYPGSDHPIHEPEGDIGWGHGLEGGNPVWLDVHGGVTWHRDMEVPHGLASGIAVGFDCAHHMDLIPGYILERNHPDPMSARRDGEYRSSSYVLAEVRKLARQISEYRPLQQLAV